MKLKTLLIGLSFLSGAAFAQDKSEACKDALSLGYDAINSQEWNFAISQYNTALSICPNDVVIYENIILAMNSKYDEMESGDDKTALGDSISTYYNTMFEKTGYNIENGAYYAYFLSTNRAPKLVEIDTLFSNYIAKNTVASDGVFALQYYINLYQLYANEQDVEKSTAYKTRFLEDYLVLSEYNAKSDSDQETKDQIQAYYESTFLNVAKECSDILPIVKKKLSELPTDKAEKKKVVENYMMLLSNKGCLSSDEYAALLKITVEEFDPTAQTVYAYGEYLYANGKKPDGLSKMKEGAGMETNTENKNLMLFKILQKVYNSGNYKKAFSDAKAISGAKKGEAIIIQAKCIAATASSNGTSTFERKSNYWMALDYLSRASASGASTSSLAAKYCERAPTVTEAFKAGFQEGDAVNCEGWGSTKVRKCN
jgi:hypothetical protein